MTIELSSADLELIDSALDIWEKQPSEEACRSSMMGIMLSGLKKNVDPTEAERQTEALFEKANKTAKERKHRGILLRAKLIQAMNRASEHEIEARP